MGASIMIISEEDLSGLARCRLYLRAISFGYSGLSRSTSLQTGLWYDLNVVDRCYVVGELGKLVFKIILLCDT